MLSTHHASSHAEGAQSNAEDSKVLVPIAPFGVAIFDDSRESGWASLGGNDSVRFRNPSDLPNDCFWVVSSEGMDYRSNWSKMSHLRSGEYISKLKYLSADLGVRMDGEGKYGASAQLAASTLATTINRAMLLASHAYQWDNPSAMLRSDTLSDDIRKHLFGLVSPPPVLNHMRAPLSASFQTYSSVPARNRPFNSVVLTLRYNRLAYAKRIMSQSVPEGSTWNLIERENDRSFNFTLDDALDPSRPCIVKAILEFNSQASDVAALAAFGISPSRSILRDHITQPELQWLSKYAKVHIQAVRYNANARPLPQKIQLPEALTSDPLLELSVAAGAVAEAHWQGLAKSTFKPSVEGKLEVNSWAAWLRAWDRAFSFELALAAHQQHFNISGYGNGSLSVFCERERLPELLDFSIEQGVAHPVFSTIFEEHGIV
jgi:hypothetical protein